MNNSNQDLSPHRLLFFVIAARFSDFLLIAIFVNLYAQYFNAFTLSRFRDYLILLLDKKNMKASLLRIGTVYEAFACYFISLHTV